MIVLNSHNSHYSTQFKAYYQKNNIITLYLPIHSSHLTQPLNIRCFSALKRIYSRELKDLIKAYIMHITKLEFFIAFKSAHFKAITPDNIKAGFQSSSLVLYNP